MAPVPDDLVAFLDAHCDSREYRRGLAVKLALQGYLYATISDMLQVTPGFVSQAKTAYETAGIAGLRLKYTGRHAYLSVDARQRVIDWLQAQATWSVDLLRAHVATTYNVHYQSDQSYYTLLADAGLTYKKAQQTNPAKNAAQIAAKKKTSTIS